MMCKTGISRLISALAICSFVAAASAQSPSGSLGGLLVPSKTGALSFELQEGANTSLFGRSGGGLLIVESGGRPISSGFSIDRARLFLLDDGRTQEGAGLSVVWPTSASAWSGPIDRAGTYRISSPNIADKPWYDDEERLITTLAIVLLILIILK
ncbi:MAG: hypothetical protein IH945_01640 [Armatimonadetes bacterium]|nr:hypothetical protein [Armatimonadota bacterium]